MKISTKTRKAAFISGALILCTIIYSYVNRNTLVNCLPVKLPDVKTAEIVLPSSPQFDEKVWLHRVNSITRAKLMEDEYRGFEIDVNYRKESNCFDVYHSPAPSTGLCLNDLLKALKDPAGKYFWLDLKNLDSSNCQEVLLLLDEITRQHGIKDKIILESPEVAYLTMFTDAGYYTSYYLPNFNSRFLSASEIKGMADSISSNLTTYKVSAISGSFVQLPFMEKYFPQCNYLLWHLDETVDIFSIYTRYRLKSNEKVKVLLVPEMSEGYR